jgi:hypothetical protein
MAQHEYALDEFIPVLTLRNKGYSYSRISAVTEIPRSTVIWLIKKHAADHCASLKASNRRGKDKELTRCEVSTIFGIPTEIADRRLIKFPNIGQETVHLHERQFSGYEKGRICKVANN